MDAKTDAPRANEPLTLNFIGDDGELYSHRHTTDENGCIHFKGSTRGEYRAAFSYFPGTASDCFHSFRLDSGDEAPIIMTVEPLAKEFRSAIVITGMLADAKGSDTNNEYIQFMALEEIDFAQTPYCVIACRNNKVNAKGWVQGSYVTYKFNLTSGRAAKGTFFYVGGVNKRLNGNSSADISGANWICSVDYNTQAGADGIGDKHPGFLHNYNSNGNKISPTASLFFRVRRSTKSVRATRSSTRHHYHGRLQPAGYGYRIPRQRSLQHEEPPVGRRSALLRAGNQYVPLSRRRQRCREFVFFGGSFTQAVTIAAVRLSAGNWPPMLRDRSPTSKAGTALRLISDSGRGARCASSLSGLPEKALSERKGGLNIFCRFNTRISPPARRSGSDRAS